MLNLYYLKYKEFSFFYLNVRCPMIQMHERKEFFLNYQPGRPNYKKNDQIIYKKNFYPINKFDHFYKFYFLKNS